MSTAKAAILGSGPSGFYTAQALLKRFPTISIDIIERLPVPFGLVRYGVAPDHPATKNVATQFSQFVDANRKQVRYLGNIPALAHRSLSLADLDNMYHCTVSATGASHPRTLPGDITLPSNGVFTAHDLILWLNGHPHTDETTAQNMAHVLKSAHDVSVVGLGNVAVDVARLLLRPVDDLKSTDMSPAALDILAQAPINNVSLIGRKSPRFASWTTAALREVVTKIPGIITLAEKSLIATDLSAPQVPRATARMLKLLDDKTVDFAERPTGSSTKTLSLEFLLEPSSIRRNEDTTSVDYVENETIDGGTQSTGRIVTKESDALFLSLGYEGGSGKGIRVGWADGRAKGIIGDNKWNVETTLENIPDNFGATQFDARPGLDEWIEKNQWEVVDWDGWKRIDEEERKRGEQFGHNRERVKLESIKEMLSVANHSAV